jgi:hypothetical protein
MILGAIGAFLLIRSYGLALVAPPALAPHTVANATGPGADVFLHVLLALSAVIITGLILAKGCAYLGQPPVIGEVIAGIVLGPSFLGADVSALLLPHTVAPFLGVMAQLGVLLYMFIVKEFPFAGCPEVSVAQGGAREESVPWERPMTGWMCWATCGRKALPYTTQHPEAMRPDDCSNSASLERLQTDLYRALGRL